MSMLAHTYLHKALENDELAIKKITRLTARFKCGLIPAVVILQAKKKSMVIHDNECPYQVSLSNTKFMQMPRVLVLPRLDTLGGECVC